MAKKEKRFVVTYAQGGLSSVGVQILVDKETGVNYLYTTSGYSGGLSPLLKQDGTPVITPLPIEEE